MTTDIKRNIDRHKKEIQNGYKTDAKISTTTILLIVYGFLVSNELFLSNPYLSLTGIVLARWMTQMRTSELFDFKQLCACVL